MDRPNGEPEKSTALKVVLKIAYQGGEFSGFQRQSKDRTVQGVLEGALSKILGETITLNGAGRTDVGVHATGQVVGFSASRVPNLGRLCHSLNSVIGASVAVLEAALLDDGSDFHPRYSAKARTYSYFLLDGCGPSETVFWPGRVWCVPESLDLDLAAQACALFQGEQDFSTFSFRMAEMETRVRRVSAISLTAEPASPFLCPVPGPRLLRLSITANGFLRRMVRLITAGVVEVAARQRPLEDLRERILCLDPARAPHPAPSEGLYLEHITYQPDPFESHRGTTRHAMAGLKSTHRVKFH